MYGRTRIFTYPVSMVSGRTLELKVRIRCFVSISLPSRLILIRFTLITFWSLQPSSNSFSVSSFRSSSETTPREVFMVRCGVTVTGKSPKETRFCNFSCCFLSQSSKRRSPLASFVALYPGPMVSLRHFTTRKGDNPRAFLSAFTE